MFVHNQPVNLMAAEAFVTVVNLGSLHKAAARLGVSSATISRRLTDLESELGVRLVERTTRSLRVTDLGRAFHDQCTRGLDALADAHDLVASNNARLGGTVRISSPPNLGPLLLGAQFLGNLSQILLVEAAEIGRALDRVQMCGL